MRRFLLAMLPLFLLNGCSSMSNTDAGILGGGALGAAIGALAGGPRHAGAGALIGGATGAVAGGLIGHSEDTQIKKQQDAVAAAQAAQAARMLSIADVVMLVQQHVDDTTIINQIRTTGSVYNLNAQDLLYLKQNGVSDPVITVMQAAQVPPPAVVVSRPVRPVYVVEQPPPPPAVSFGVAVGH
jgi:hypothetical protein